MRIVRLLTLCVWIASVTAWAVDPPCNLATEISVLDGKLKELRSDTRLAMARGVEIYRAERLKQYGQLLRGKKLQVGDLIHIPSYVLGDGAEGVVYLIELPRQPGGSSRYTVVKEFKSLGQLQHSLEGWEAKRRAGLPVVNMRAVDLQHLTVELEYVEGIPLSRLLRRAAEYGLRQSQFEEIVARLRVMGVDNLESGPGYMRTAWGLPTNTVVDVNGNPVIIDAQ